MRTLRSPSPSRERLVDAAVDLMRAKGYEATSVDDVCRATGLTKGAFFHYFASKEELAKAALERFCKSQAEKLASAPFVRKRDPMARVDGLIDCLIAMARDPLTRQGCLVGALSQELSETHPELRACCAEEFESLATRFRRELDTLKAASAPRSGIDTQSLARHFVAVLQGAMLLAKARKDPRVVQESLQHLRSYLHGLFAR